MLQELSLCLLFILASLGCKIEYLGFILVFSICTRETASHSCRQSWIGLMGALVFMYSNMWSRSANQNESLSIRSNVLTTGTWATSMHRPSIVLVSLRWLCNALHWSKSCHRCVISERKIISWLWILFSKGNKGLAFFRILMKFEVLSHRNCSGITSSVFSWHIYMKNCCFGKISMNFVANDHTYN